MGNEVFPNLKGTLKGEYEMDTQTGMFLNSNLNSELNGTINMRGREIPISIETTDKNERKKD